ncbi:tetratricopeptide repeat protein [Pseudodesulfovibrio sp.]|uniref:tetratricopeptide repeat protein n=1 Tax=unclassified Pseudodesulfovibrio TaxID=2661612 RepID=UPI003B00C291
MPGQYDHIIHRFLAEQGGAVVCLSDDVTFIRSLRNILLRLIGFKGEILFSFTHEGHALEKCLELRDQGTPCLVFVERRIENHPSTDFLIRLKREFPACLVVVLTWEATQETVAYFFELGISRVLVKPASADRAIEEMAMSISPPGELRKQMERCDRLLAGGDFYKALEATDRILVLSPDSARGLVMRGDALTGIGDTDKAVQAYMAAHESRPIYMEPLIKLARAFNGMDDEKALGYLEQLDEISPLNPERKIDIAEQHLRQGDAEKAEAYLDRSMEVAERELLSHVGDLTERIVDAVAPQAPNLAVKYLNRVIDNKRVLGRDDLVHFNRLGIILRGEGKWQEAVDVYQRALTIAPDDPVVHYNMGLAYWEGEERMKGLKSFEQALALDPNFYVGSVGAALNIGSLYLDLRQFDDAVPYLRHVLKLDPENQTARKRLKDAEDRVSAPRPRRGREREDEQDASPGLDLDAMKNDSGLKKRTATGSGGKAFDLDSLPDSPGPDKGGKKQPRGKGHRFDF